MTGQVVMSSLPPPIRFSRPFPGGAVWGALVLQQLEVASMSFVMLGDSFRVFCGGVGWSRHRWATLLNPRRRRLLPTTKTLDSAIAAPASMGLSMPSAAIGI